MQLDDREPAIADPIATPVFSTPRLSLRERLKNSCHSKRRQGGDAGPSTPKPDLSKAESIEESFSVDPRLLTGQANEYIPPSPDELEGAYHKERDPVRRRIDLGNAEDNIEKAVEGSELEALAFPGVLQAPTPTPPLGQKDQRKPDSGEQDEGGHHAGSRRNPTASDGDGSPPKRARLPPLPSQRQQALASGDVWASPSEVPRALSLEIPYASPSRKFPVSPSQDPHEVPSRPPYASLSQLPRASDSGLRRESPSYSIRDLFPNSGGLLSNHISLTMESLVPRVHTPSPPVEDRNNLGVERGNVAKLPSPEDTPRKTLCFEGEGVSLPSVRQGQNPGAKVAKESKRRIAKDDSEDERGRRGSGVERAVSHSNPNVPDKSQGLTPGDDIGTERRITSPDIRPTSRRAKSPVRMPVIPASDESSKEEEEAGASGRVSHQAIEEQIGNDLTDSNAEFPILPRPIFAESGRMASDEAEEGASPPANVRAEGSRGSRTPSDQGVRRALNAIPETPAVIPETPTIIPETPAAVAKNPEDCSTEPPSPQPALSAPAGHGPYPAGTLLCRPLRVNIPAGALRSPPTPESDDAE